MPVRKEGALAIRREVCVYAHFVARGWRVLEPSSARCRGCARKSLARANASIRQPRAPIRVSASRTEQGCGRPAMRACAESLRTRTSMYSYSTPAPAPTCPSPHCASQNAAPRSVLNAAFGLLCIKVRIWSTLYTTLHFDPNTTQSILIIRLNDYCANCSCIHFVFRMNVLWTFWGFSIPDNLHNGCSSSFVNVHMCYNIHRMVEK